ncbi:hypothetical protein ACFOHK_17660 [Falsigemmobacter intermedius]|uniref:hypothetical protein n=1 Tax=Falsigemmobacter intermedius TaxID=1553448 RepID=UPI00361C1F9E
MSFMPHQRPLNHPKVSVNSYMFDGQIAYEFGTLHDTEVFGVAVIGESESSDGLDLAKGTVH